MQKNPRLRRIHPGWYAGAFVAVLAIAAQVVYSTGLYGSWRDSRSVDRACGGNVARPELATALESSHLRARSLELDDGYLAHCLVLRADSARNGSLEMSLRWSSTGPAPLEAFPSDITNGFKGAASPLGKGWPGIARSGDGGAVQVALDCRNDRGKALIAHGRFAPPGFAPSRSTAALTGLGQVTAETARKAAEKYGCRTSGGGKLSDVSAPPVGAGSYRAKPLGQSQGSCAALRDLAPTATPSGTPLAVEFPADTRAPQVNCYLATASQKPGYGLFAFYGATAKEFRTSAAARSLKRLEGDLAEDKDSVWATAQCPQSAEPASFLLTRLQEVTASAVTYPAPRSSPDFANTALKAFADGEAKQRGCTDVRMTTQP
ncbi:hypothetical protein ACFYM2_20665 [Streptomyces sp. NPDC006711]|uniref:hypothetical protein n=1 Tax=Streptomyces sp. NPDC006711 TaxID=3364762 RepID=UPI0036C9799A